MIRKKFEPDVYGMTLMLLVGDRADVNRALFRVCAENMPEDSQGFHVQIGKEEGSDEDLHIVCISTERMNRNLRIRFLAHELLHVVFDVFDSRNVKYNGDSDEAFNYYFDGWLFDCLPFV